ncbi:MAG: hypothetical protein WBG91_08260, partial [Syntrophobacteria bacterium]
ILGIISFHSNRVNRSHNQEFPQKWMVDVYTLELLPSRGLIWKGNNVFLVLLLSFQGSGLVTSSAAACGGRGRLRNNEHLSLLSFHS